MNQVGFAIQRRIAPRNISIISDDCWGGQYYRRMGIPYLSPTVGCWIEPAGYVDLIRQILSGNALSAELAPDSAEYPILTAGGARFHYIHDTDAGKTLETFSRRWERLNPARLFFKVDFGKYYKAREVDAWNNLKLRNSVALFPRDSAIAAGAPIHNGVAIDDWTIDGAKMYGISERKFSVIRWLRTGKIGCSRSYALFHRLFLDAPVR